MATYNYMTLANLQEYDGLIKQYIGEENASSIKSISVSGNTVSFFRTDDATGTAAYEITLPDVSGFMSKIASATGGKIVTSTATGEVAESGTAIADLATNAFVGTIPSGATATTVTGYAKEVADSKDAAITAAQNAADAAQSDVDALETYVGTIPGTATATDVVGYVDEAVDAAVDDSEVTITEAQTPTTGYLKTYEISQGGTLIGKIDIPKDLVVTSGEVVVNPTGQPAGTYLKLTIANQAEPVYINVADLCDVYTAASGAAQVQLVISSTNEISATLVAGGVGTTELANNAVTTAKITDGNVTKAKLAQGVQDSLDLADSAVQSVAEGATNGTVAVDGTDVAVHGLGSAAYTASTAYEAAGSIATAIGALDATKSQTAGADGLALSITETDGKITSISGSIANGTYASAAQGDLADSALQPSDIGSIDSSDIAALFS